ncbi:bifunctional 4-hydroxy-2-oxoglutarate aldolase/2-dehydro-3-deoxy-phosphogluconate aldolase [Thermus oshimai]|jgi:2-dehydro-3-deoxyphosphogluconate aldolase/(4S)-4-hydroxy-2-oxoglutarate aldolase|uniref:bifunctional 4-hydroxy-2-oxoglutarate aldolase/2-dehydro-3-deoxy-phosphogluconate aldolase n=1 Tax=Thermus TaxID=270 RepID=UPI00037AF8C4|nr:bifunctional 4-hydroxy-2-oxoglutarate aldolase/2-dehydro-3-deoxy-phosphogluconate aldolase [Thermus oshimai]
MAPALEAALAAAKVLPILTPRTLEGLEGLGEALLEAGFSWMEVTLRTPLALEAIRRLRALGLEVGAGTVLNEAQAEEALAAGASFLVSPGLSPGLARWAEAQGLPYLPGVATPTEVQEALALGLRLLKFFPAEAMGGVRTLKAYAPVFPGVRFVPTGGIGPETLEAYLALENVLACGGSWLLEGSLEEVRTKLRGLGKLRPQAQR